MNVLDLFSGIGGFSVGLEKAGMTTKMFCEIDPDARKVLRKNWPTVPIWQDVVNLKKEDIDHLDIDVICGGFPCTDISVAGEGKGFRDEETGEITRSGLWIEFKRLIKEIKPKYVIIENVANLRSKGLAEVIKDLWKIGYVGEWHIISARSVGAPHLRERCWIIAYPDSSRIRKQSGRGSRKNRESKDVTFSNGKNGSVKSSNTNNFRFWKPFATKEEKQEWWTKATTGIGYWRKTECPACGVSDGISDKLDRAERLGKRADRIRKRIRKIKSRIEHIRKERIKQLGNAVVPQIPEMIGKAIMEYEASKNNYE